MSKLKKYSLILIAIVIVMASALTVYATDQTTGSLTIITHEQKNGDETTNPVMAGIEYTIYKVDESIENYWDASVYVENNSIQGVTKTTGTDGKAIFSNLELGRYYVMVTSFPDGVNNQIHDFLVDIPMTNTEGTGLDYDVIVEPKISTAYGNIELTKVDGAGNPIEGVIFKVQIRNYGGNGRSFDDLPQSERWIDYIPEEASSVLTVTTDSNGKIKLTNLPSGMYVRYRLIEVSGPEGYIVNNGIISDMDWDIGWNGSIYPYVSDDFNYNYLQITETENLTSVIYTNDKPTITKKVKNSAGNFVDAAGMNATDTITFKVTTDVPMQIAMMDTYKVTDVLPVGLTLDRNSIKIEGTIASGSEEISTDIYTLSDTGLELTFDTSKMVDSNGDLLYSAIIVTYDATVNIDNVVIGGDGNINTASLTYTDFIEEGYYDENWDWVEPAETSTNTITDTAEVHTGALKIEKVEKGNTETKLAGAKFKIATTEANAEAGTFVKDADGNDIEVTTDSNGLAEIKGLAYADDGSDTSYWLVETQAPTYEDTVDGQAVTKSYNLLQNPIEVQVGKTTYETAVQVQNSKGLDLPATGGIGIAIFAIAGITLMVISKKMSKEELK